MLMTQPIGDGSRSPCDVGLSGASRVCDLGRSRGGLARRLSYARGQQPAGGGAIRRHFIRPGAGQWQSAGAAIQRQTGRLLAGAPLQHRAGPGIDHPGIRRGLRHFPGNAPDIMPEFNLGFVAEENGMARRFQRMHDLDQDCRSLGIVGQALVVAQNRHAQRALA